MKIRDFYIQASFSQKLQMVQGPTIRHLKALVVENKNLGGQGRGSLKGLPRPCFLKSTLFTNSGRGKPLIMPRPCPSRIQTSIIRPFKKGIICFSATFSSGVIKLFVF